MNSKKINPTAAELEILNILWKDEPLTVREIHEQLTRKKNVGYTTALKIMQNMTAKGLLKREQKGKSHLYHSVFPQEETQKSLLDKFVETTFEGSASSLVMQLLGNSNTTEDEIKEIKEIIRQMENEKQS
ncbi:MAG: BlaI/MecI/CopY family transcriptional regulator [Bacteroidales bacterium]|nr:BlaI/MecI/CopY family transcriptional regulator [Bacteroidales bacterium]